jgi:hypothetical protein
MTASFIALPRYPLNPRADLLAMTILSAQRASMLSDKLIPTGVDRVAGLSDNPLLYPLANLLAL